MRRLAQETAPFSLGSTVSRIDQRPISPADETKTSASYRTDGTLAFTGRTGIEATLTASTTRAKTENSPTFTELGPDTTEIDTTQHTLTADLAYDLIKGGKYGRGKTQERIEVLAQEQKQKLLQGEQLQLNLQVYGQLVDLYATACKLAGLRGARAITTKIVENGKIKVESKLVAYKDFLNFATLDQSVATRAAQQEAALEEQLQSLARVSPAIRAQAAALRLDEACLPGTDEPLRELLGQEAALKKAALRLPSYLAAEVAYESSKQQLGLTRLDNRFSLKPFVQAQYGKNQGDTDTRDTGQTTLGLRFQWTLPQGHGDLAETSARSDLRSRKLELQSRGFEADSLVAGLIERGRSQQLLLGVVRQSIDSSERLLKTLVVQQDAGIVDSLSYSNAQLGLIDAKESLIGIWATLEKAAFEATTYVKFAAVAGAKS